MKITTLCDPLCSLWFNLPYYNQIHRKSGKVHALAKYQRAKTERNRSGPVRIAPSRKQCSNERVSGQEEHEQQTKNHPHRSLVKPRSQHEEDACERQGDHEREVGITFGDPGLFRMTSTLYETAILAAAIGIPAAMIK